MTEETLEQLTKDQAINDLVTPHGKQIGIYHVKNTALYKAAFESGGELPKELNGMFTDTTKAREAARKYVQRKWDEETAEKRGPGRPKKAENTDAKSEESSERRASS